MSFQKKTKEMSTSQASLQKVNATDLNIQNEIKKSRLQKLKLNTVKNQLILDVGCGPGTYGLILASEGNEVVGIDISVDAIRLANDRARKERVLTFMPIVADLESLPLRNEVFDICFVGWALHHFPTLDVVSDFAAVLKDNGIMALAEPNELHPALIISRYAENIFKGLLGETGLFTDNVSVHTCEDYCEYLKNNGFIITMLASCYSREPVIIPHDVRFLKRMILQFSLAIRHILCASITDIQSSLNGTDLLILANKQ